MRFHGRINLIYRHVFIKPFTRFGLWKEVIRFAKDLIKSENDLTALDSLSDNQQYHLTALLTVDKKFSHGLFRPAD